MGSPTKQTWNRRNARDAKKLKKRQTRVRLANARKVTGKAASPTKAK